MKISLFLPIPVTVNNIYSNNRRWGRVKTKAAKDWEREARHSVQIFLREYNAICRANLRARAKHYINAKRGYDLTALRAAHPNLSYQVVYRYHFPDPNIRDIFNFEKLLSDFLVDCGFMLDDLFIDDGRVIRLKPRASAACVDVEINTLDLEKENC